jgi:hypothetical protein
VQEDENQSLLDALNAEEPPAEPEAADPFASPEAPLGMPGEPLAEIPAEGDSGEAAELAAALESIVPGEGESFEGSDLFPAEGENPDPALAVNEMLSEAVAAEPPPSFEPAAEPILESAPGPTSQVELRFPEGFAGHAEFKSLAGSLQIGLPEGNSPLLSRLTEFQAIALHQRALQLGVPATTGVHFPLPALTEEEQALGELAAVPDTALPEIEGAPSVLLPKREKDVMVIPESAPGVTLVESLGLVTAHRSIARRFFREEEAEEKLRRELERLPVKDGNLPESRLEALFRDLLLDLRKSVLQKGGNALLGFRFESFPETSHLDPEMEQLRLVAFGTAAVVEKA